jgi:hypothetical protein
MTPSGIEPAAFRFVAQYLNQLRHRGWYINLTAIYVSNSAIILLQSEKLNTELFLQCRNGFRC